MSLIALGRPVCALISLFRGRLKKKKKTAQKLQTSAGNKQWMRRYDCYDLRRTKAVVFAFRGSRDESAQRQEQIMAGWL